MIDTSFWQGKTAVVTGASGGIGGALAQRIAEFGIRTVLSGRNEEKLRACAARIKEAGGEADILAGDLTDPAFRALLLASAAEKTGAVDILVNCAGLAQNEPFEEVTPETYDAIMETNVRTPYLLTQEALPFLRKSDLATVINICSVCAHKGYPLQSVYSASKHALLGWSKSLANEVCKENIRIHIISPGGVFTDMVRIARPDLSPEGMTLPSDVAEAAAFFLTMRKADAVIDEIELHRPAKQPFA